MSASNARESSGPRARRLAAELPRRYPHWGPVRRLSPVSGGFSGAALFRIDAEAGAFAVKLSPFAENLLEATVARHQILEAIAGIAKPPLFPQLARDASGATVWLLASDAESFVVEARHWLEDSPQWTTSAILMPGSTENRAVTSVEIASAFRLLARFHAAAGPAVARVGPSPCLRTGTPLPDRYLHEWHQVRRIDWEAIRAEMHRLPLDLREPVREYLAHLSANGLRIGASLDELPGTPPPLCLCLRDTHRNNIAFREGIATAFLDWDALRFDRRIGDFARLAASFGLSAAEAESEAASAIQEASPADELDRWETAALAPLLATQVWLPPLTWLKWLLVEHRAFDDPAAAFGRLRETLNLSILRPGAADET